MLQFPVVTESPTQATVGVLHAPPLTLPPAKSCGGMLASPVTVTFAGQVIEGSVLPMVTVFWYVLEVQPPLLVVSERVKLPLLPGITATC